MNAVVRMRLTLEMKTTALHESVQYLFPFHVNVHEKRPVSYELVCLILIYLRRSEQSQDQMKNEDLTFVRRNFSSSSFILIFSTATGDSCLSLIAFPTISTDYERLPFMYAPLIFHSF